MQFYLTYLNIINLNYNILSHFLKIGTQIAYGWSDWFRDESHDKVENRMWNFSDAYPGISGKEFEETHIAPVQKDLKGLV